MNVEAAEDRPAIEAFHQSPRRQLPSLPRAGTDFAVRFSGRGKYRETCSARVEDGALLPPQVVCDGWRDRLSGYISVPRQSSTPLSLASSRPTPSREMERPPFTRSQTRAKDCGRVASFILHSWEGRSGRHILNQLVRRPSKTRIFGNVAIQRVHRKRLRQLQYMRGALLSLPSSRGRGFNRRSFEQSEIAEIINTVNTR